MKNIYLLDKNEIADLAKSLRQIEQKIIKQGYKTGSRKIWFQGEEPYFDIFFEVQDEEITWFQFTLRGKCLSWDKKSPVIQTGNTDELKMNDVSFYAASKTIETDNEADVQFVNLVKSILQSRTEEKIFARALELFY